MFLYLMQSQMVKSMFEGAKMTTAEIQRRYDEKLREVKRLKTAISAMKQKAYFDRKYTNVKIYTDTLHAHKNAVKTLLALQSELNKSKAENKAANEPFNIRFIRAARQILDNATFEQIEIAAELNEQQDKTRLGKTVQGTSAR